jgi:hypothetical protein
VKMILIAALALAATVAVAARFSQQPRVVHAAVTPDVSCVDTLADTSILPTVFAGAISSKVVECLPAVGETFAAVNLVHGEGLRVVLSNVLAPAAGTPLSVCPAVVQFIDADGNVVGSPESVNLDPGASASVPAKSGSGLLLRGSFAVFANPAAPTAPGDPDGICAIRSVQEVFDVTSGRTSESDPSPNCVGHGVSAGFTRPCA